MVGGCVDQDAMVFMMIWVEGCDGKEGGGRRVGGGNGIEGGNFIFGALRCGLAGLKFLYLLC